MMIDKQESKKITALNNTIRELGKHKKNGFTGDIRLNFYRGEIKKVERTEKII